MPMRTLSVMQAKRFGVWTTASTATLLEVAREMVDRNISGLVVVDAEGCLEGLITRTDLVRAAHDRRDWTNPTAAAYNLRNAVTAPLQDTLQHVMDLLIEHHVHRVVAVEPEDDKLRPIAVLSAADVVYHMAQEKYVM